jgi:PQQ-dependent dehydrogenase (s-GDH family)
VQQAMTKSNSMKQGFLLTALCLLLLGYRAKPQSPIIASRLQETFNASTLVSQLSDPWDILYGKDNYLWVTEARGYRVRRVHPQTGAMQTVLDLNALRNFPRYDKISDAVDGGKPWPQGGLMGMAMHPNFRTGKPFIYLTYVHTYNGSASSGNGCLTNSGGCFFRSRIVRYQYDSVAQQLISPLVLCDTIPGSNDHNSGRLLIAPVNGVYYLFSSVGDMGGGQFQNGNRAIHSQDTNYYEGKILRWNLEPDGDSDIYDRWIPDDNPFNNGSVQRAIWSIGHRNPQGLTYARINNQDRIFSTEHGPFSDDELNVIERGKNYGHPLVIGANDGNYNNAAAGASSNAALPGAHNSSAPLIASENTNVNSVIGAANFRAPLKAFFSPNNSTVVNIMNAVIGGNNDNSGWPSEGISSVEYYGGGPVPNWYGSLFITTLKGGKIIRMKLNNAGTGFEQLAGADTVGYFRSQNRFRDVAFSPDGATIFAIVDSSSVTSGPSSGNPQVILSRGAILKFTYSNGGILPVDPADPTVATKKTYKVSVLPNPTSKYIIVNFEIGVHKPVEYRLVDMTGKTVLMGRTNQNSFTIEVGHLKRGVYILRLFNGYGVEVKMEKMILQ